MEIKIKWSDDDIKVALLNKGYAPTEKNIELLKKNRLERTLQEVSVQYGWEIIDEIILDTENLEEDKF